MTSIEPQPASPVLAGSLAPARAAEPTFAAQGARAPLGWRLLGALLRPFLRVRAEPPDPLELLESADTPLLYILERPGTSNLLILEEACRSAGLPPPLRRSDQLSLGARQRAVIVLHPRIPRFSRKRPSTYPPEPVSYTHLTLPTNREV